ncbi:hypothetical protein E2C01_000329 [Portunus trituberculatus]|uniref:Uncharacterized protein n=1 Tax=Portunus trituberculatus TaxID=210409 RepID=A0A5B7CDT1_PORTR|nr:hypothetical protein [Portunus trituberculatus]
MAHNFECFIFSSNVIHTTSAPVSHFTLTFSEDVYWRRHVVPCSRIDNKIHADNNKYGLVSHSGTTFTLLHQNRCHSPSLAAHSHVDV